MYRTLTPYLLIGAFALSFCQSKEQSGTIDPVAKSLEYQSWETTEKPQGSAAYLGLGTYAKCLCTAVFESNRKPEEYAENSGGMTLEEEYVDLVQYEIDYGQKNAKASLGDSIFRIATYVGDQGCILDIEKGLHFDPVKVITSLSDAESMDWPMGDKIEPLADHYPKKLLEKAADLAFDPQAITAAFLVVHKDNIILERYRAEITKDTQLESWSMGKSLTATFVGRLIQTGKLSLDQKAPVKEWQREGDPRADITIRNLLQMSSGLRFPSYGRTRNNSVAGSTSYDADGSINPHLSIYRINQHI